MTFSVFIGKFAAEFDETPLEAFNASTDFKGLDDGGHWLLFLLFQ